jgi:predicted nucleic acid-binding Zn ribbon protein
MPTMSEAETRHCIKCGRDIGPDETLCEICNRAGMSTPSASQYHGTVAVAIVLAVAALAVAASLSMRGMGPYAAEVRGVAPGEPAGYAISYAVTNEGTNSGRGKCQVATYDEEGRRVRVTAAVTDPIPGGDTIETSVTIPGLEAVPARITVTCS